MFELVNKRNWFFAISLLITIPGLIFILLTPITGGKEGLKFSIDYTGGTEWSIKFQDPNVQPEAVRAALIGLGQQDATVTRTGTGYLDIRMNQLDLRPPETAGPTPCPSGSPAAGGSPAASGAAAPSATPCPSESPGASASASPAASAAPSPGASASASPSASGAGVAPGSPGASSQPSASPEPSPTPAPSGSPEPSPSASSAPTGNTEIPRTGAMGVIVSGLESRFGPIASQLSLSSIGAVVSSDLIQQAILLILVGSLGILGWITLRFRDVKFGVTALVALLHDVIVVLGIFAILGTLLGVQVDGLFVTAMLTVIGFSVHDTIVVFDRIRENRARHAGEPFAEIVNHSLLQTFGRSITTSFTVVLTLTALLLFGGSATQEFVLALLIGIVSGTYSSIFVASMLLVVWQEWEERRRGRLPQPRGPRTARPASA
ncbi:MAG TPA: protein translocase subunit SecF [Candidatus Limnocylindrales bacterium]|nr:protein translocase subunit SecF [Candidatus Limnocylindrales bacterium]